MLTPMPAAKVLDREFLEIRAKILQLAASLDRLERGAGSVERDARMKLIHRALDILKSGTPEHDRAEQVQILFSRQYDEHWRENLGVK